MKSHAFWEVAPEAKPVCSITHQPVLLCLERLGWDTNNVKKRSEKILMPILKTVKTVCFILTFSFVFFHSEQFAEPVQKIERSFVISGGIWKALSCKSVHFHCFVFFIQQEFDICNIGCLCSCHIFINTLCPLLQSIRSYVMLLWRCTEPSAGWGLPDWWGKAWLNSTCKQVWEYYFDQSLICLTKSLNEFASIRVQ